MRRKQSLFEMVLHPYANLRRIQGLDRLPDRRVSKHKRHPREHDPLREQGMAAAIYKALGVYAQEESRTELYENFREMDYDALISAVLDAFGEDASQVDPEHGSVLWVESSNPDIKKIVGSCIHRTGANDLAYPVQRTLGRDGDVMMHIAAARGEGVIAMRAYDPWAVARVEDDIGRLIGFAPADDKGNPTKQDSHAVSPWKVAHFRLPARDLTNIYGAESSFLWGSRILWRELQLMLDQVVMQRLLRRPDRLAILVDTMGLSHDDAHYFVEDMQRRLYREWHLNPGGSGFLGGFSQFQSQGALADGGYDVVIPKGPQNNTTIENFPATNQNDLLRDLELMYRNLANGIGFPHGFMRGEGGQYRADQSLSRQHHPFAKRATRLQRAFLHEMVRVCMIDMAYKGLNPMLPEHEFSLHMAPVSPILELERHEVIQMKMDRLERALRIGIDNQFDQGFWVPFVLKTYGGFSDDVVSALYKGEDGAESQPSASSMQAGEADAAYVAERARNGSGKKGKAAPDRKALEEAFRRIIPSASPDAQRAVSSKTTLDVMAETAEVEWLKPKGDGKKILAEAWHSKKKEEREAVVNDKLTTNLTEKRPIKPDTNRSKAVSLRKRSVETRRKVMEGFMALAR